MWGGRLIIRAIWPVSHAPLDGGPREESEKWQRACVRNGPKRRNVHNACLPRNQVQGEKKVMDRLCPAASTFLFLKSCAFARQLDKFEISPIERVDFFESIILGQSLTLYILHVYRSLVGCVASVWAAGLHHIIHHRILLLYIHSIRFRYYMWTGQRMMFEIFRGRKKGKSIVYLWCIKRAVIGPEGAPNIYTFLYILSALYIEKYIYIKKKMKRKPRQKSVAQ